MSKYQVAILAPNAFAEAEILRDTIERRVADLGVPAEALQFFSDEDVASVDPKAAVVGVYLALSSAARHLSPGLERLLQSGTTIVPVVQNRERIADLLPERLRAINAMEVAGEDPRLERIAAVVLENLSLLRLTRRLFISYRQAETAHVAIQLYGNLDAHGFDVFLDAQSIRPGERFAEVLWHRLADTDVIVLLDSPGFLQSRWTVEELARANTSNIQILQLIWPETTLVAEAAFSRPFPLRRTDFRDTQTSGREAALTDECLQRIAISVEALRARALAARYTYLVREFLLEAETEGLAPVIQPQRVISLEAGGRSVAVVPTVGIPDALRYQEIEDLLEVDSRKGSRVMLLFDERGVGQKWLAHIAWLDKHLRIRSLELARARDWLRALRA
jgi:hypothetical protein